jgi:hypothetical protein
VPKNYKPGNKNMIILTLKLTAAFVVLLAYWIGCFRFAWWMHEGGYKYLGFGLWMVGLMIPFIMLIAWSITNAW